MLLLRKSLKVGSLKIYFGYFALLICGCLLANIRIIFAPSVANYTEGFLYLLWEGVLPHVAILLSCSSIFFISWEDKGSEKLSFKRNLVSSCLGGVILFISTLSVAIISLIIFPAFSDQTLSMSIQNSVFGIFYPHWNGKLLIIIVAIISFLGGCVWSTIARFASKTFNNKLFGVCLTIIIYYLLNVVINGSAQPYLAPYYLMFPTLLTNIPIYIVVIVQILLLMLFSYNFNQHIFISRLLSKLALKKLPLYAIISIVVAIVYSCICMAPIFKASIVSGYNINIMEPICFLLSTENSIVILCSICVIGSIFIHNNIAYKNQTRTILISIAFVVCFYLSIILISSALFSTRGFLNNNWSKFTYYYTNTSFGEKMSGFQIAFSPSYIAAFQPFSFLFTSAGLCALLSLFCIASVQLINSALQTDKGVIIILIFLEIWSFMLQMSIYVQFFSPVAHAIIGNHSYGYDYKPTVQASMLTLSIGIVVIFILNHFIQYCFRNTKKV